MRFGYLVRRVVRCSQCDALPLIDFNAMQYNSVL